MIKFRFRKNQGLEEPATDILKRIEYLTKDKTSFIAENMYQKEIKLIEDTYKEVERINCDD